MKESIDIFVLLFKNIVHWTSYKGHFLPTVEIKDYDVMMDEKNFFDQSAKNDQETYDTVRKSATGPGDDYKTGSLLHYVYFKNYN